MKFFSLLLSLSAAAFLTRARVHSGARGPTGDSGRLTDAEFSKWLQEMDVDALLDGIDTSDMDFSDDIAELREAERAKHADDGPTGHEDEHDAGADEAALEGPLEDDEAAVLEKCATAFMATPRDEATLDGADCTLEGDWGDFAVFDGKFRAHFPEALEWFAKNLPTCVDRLTQAQNAEKEDRVKLAGMVDRSASAVKKEREHLKLISDCEILSTATLTARMKSHKACAEVAKDRLERPSGKTPVEIKAEFDSCAKAGKKLEGVMNLVAARVTKAYELFKAGDGAD